MQSTLNIPYPGTESDTTVPYEHSLPFLTHFGRSPMYYQRLSLCPTGPYVTLQYPRYYKPTPDTRPHHLAGSKLEYGQLNQDPRRSVFYYHGQGIRYDPEEPAFSYAALNQSQCEPKPSDSYIGLLAKAILESPNKKLLLGEIYEYMLKTYPYFRSRGSGWRNSVRHNLSLNECFVKVGRSDNGKGHYWSIHPANTRDFERCDFRRRRAQRKVRRYMGLTYSDDDDLDDDIEENDSMNDVNATRDEQDDEIVDVVNDDIYPLDEKAKYKNDSRSYVVFDTKQGRCSSDEDEEEKKARPTFEANYPSVNCADDETASAKHDELNEYIGTHSTHRELSSELSKDRFPFTVCSARGISQQTPVLDSFKLPPDEQLSAKRLKIDVTEFSKSNMLDCYKKDNDIVLSSSTKSNKLYTPNKLLANYDSQSSNCSHTITSDVSQLKNVNLKYDVGHKTSIGDNSIICRTATKKRRFDMDSILNN